jgi:hypothetical protein
MQVISFYILAQIADTYVENLMGIFTMFVYIYYVYWQLAWHYDAYPMYGKYASVAGCIRLNISEVVGEPALRLTSCGARSPLESFARCPFRLMLTSMRSRHLKSPRQA